MKIAVTDTGKEDKLQLYIHWLRSINAEAEFCDVSYQKNFSKEEIEQCDGLVLTGGEDIHPAASKALPVEVVKKVDLKRDHFEFCLLEKALKKHIPVLGICRGMQVVNVFLGGTLIADLPYEGIHGHEANESETTHSIVVNAGTALHEITGLNTGEVNSFHHQAVKDLAQELTATSCSPDGVIESVEWKQKGGKSFLMAVQWHPERMADKKNPFSKQIGEAFFKAVRNFQLKK